MKTLCFVITASLVLLVSCRKHTNSHHSVNPKSLQGVWIEKTLRLDTLDFDESKLTFGDSTVFLKSKVLWDYSISTTYPVQVSSIYSYYISGDSIYLYNFVSSCLCYGNYWFKMNNDQSAFQIARFYRRNSLPDIIEFERMK